MSNYTVVEYTTKKDKKYYIQVYLRKKSMGIRNTTDMLELCYREKFEILENLCYFLRCIHEIEFKGKERIKFTRDVHHMAQEILFHMDFYILSEMKRKKIKINNEILDFLLKLVPIKTVELQTLLISARMSNTILDVALKELSKHTFSSDIGSNINEDPDSKYIDSIYDFIKRSEGIVINLQFYKLGKNVNFPRENGKNVKYKCKYGDVIIQKIDNGKVEKMDIRKLY
jgi:hypothetical protein